MEARDFREDARLWFSLHKGRWGGGDVLDSRADLGSGGLGKGEKSGTDERKRKNFSAIPFY